MKKQIELTRAQIYEGYSACLSNAIQLLDAGSDLQGKNRVPISIGLLEIGQEELGKSFSLLASFGNQSPGEWKVFWREWRDHEKKAYRAFFYEWIHPLSFGFQKDGRLMRFGVGKHEHIPREKELSFYVDYDPAKETFVSPASSIEFIDVANRAFTLIALGHTALTLKDVLDAGDKEWNYRTYSEIPRIIIGPGIYQQQMPFLYESFSKRSLQHKELIDRIIAKLPFPEEDKSEPNQAL